MHYRRGEVSCLLIFCCSTITDEGMRNIKYSPQHVQALRQAVEGAGGRMPHIYLTMGQYDLIAVIEAPSDDTCVSITPGFVQPG